MNILFVMNIFPKEFTAIKFDKTSSKARRFRDLKYFCYRCMYKFNFTERRPFILVRFFVSIHFAVKLNIDLLYSENCLLNICSSKIIDSNSEKL